MFLPQPSLIHISAVSHEGKVVLVATDGSGALFYSVRQDGFEDNYLNQPVDQRTGWEAWQPLPLPDEKDDPSVVEKEKQELTYKDTPDVFILRSRYKTDKETAVAPVQLVSGIGHLYVFRQSNSGTLLVDRFVLDGLTNKLTRKLEVRFKRSGQRHKPVATQRQTPSGLQNIDSLDFRDTKGDFFYEPTTELAFINNVVSGWFAVVLVPTSEHEKYRWHIFVADRQVQLITVQASDDGLFDVKDYTVFEPSAAQAGALVPRSIPGIIRRTLDLQVMNLNAGPTATKYDLQQEQAIANSDKTQLIKAGTRLMLVIPTSSGTAALSFAIAADGTLAQFSETPQNRILRSKERTILLPLNTLDAIKPIADRSPPAHGVVRGVQLGTADQGAEDQVVISSDQAATLEDGDLVEIKGTMHYNGLYQVSSVAGDSFNILAKWNNNELGFWEKQEEEGGLIFDGLLTAYEKTPDGKLKATAIAHGLADGDQVQLIGTVSQNGVYPIRKLNDSQFVIERRWTPGEAVNVKAESRKRRGLVLDGQDDYVELPATSVPTGGEISITFWAKGGATLPKDTVILEGLDKNSNRQLMIHLPWGDGSVYFDCGSDGAPPVDRMAKAAAVAECRGEWTHWAFTKDAAAGQMKIYRNGELWHSTSGKFKKIAEVARLRLGALVSTTGGYYEGTLAELCIWKRTLSEEEIRNGAYLTLTGREIGLVSYYRLGAVVEGETRQVVDSALGGGSGTVYGGAYAGSVTLARTLRDGVTPAVKYVNEELLAVTQRATYIEEFEFKIHRSAAVDLAFVNNADGTGNKIFTLSYWGKSSRSAEDKLAITATPDGFVDLGGGWFRASCRFTVPDGVALLRSFAITDVKGAWDSLELRKQRLRMISDTIGEAQYHDRLSLTAVADSYGPLAAQVATMAAKEQQEADLLKEKRRLELALRLLASRAAQQARRKMLSVEVPALVTEEATRHKQYDDAINDPLNYICTISEEYETAKRLQQYGSFVILTNVSGVATQLFKFVPAGDGTYYIFNGGAGYRDSLIASDPVVIVGPHNPHTSRRWSIVQRYGRSGLHEIRTSYFNPNRPSNLVATTNSNELFAFTTTDNRGGWMSFVLNKTGELADDGRIAAAKKAWDDKAAELKSKQTELNELNQLLGLDQAQQAELEARLRTVNGQLAQLALQLNTLSNQILDGLQKTQNAAQAMPTVATDSRQLATRGALLPFVRPRGSVSALETCEGNVQLSYFDERGCIRLTNYDATADSNNSTFEQWIPEAQRACLRLDGDPSVLSLATPVALKQEWTIEAWFSYPLPDKTWNTLTTSMDDGDQQLVVFAGKYLGTRLSGMFFNSGYALDVLSAGWHHVSVVKRLLGPDGATLTFYLDGAPAARIALPLGALSLDGQDDKLELPGVCLPKDPQITICFWVKDAFELAANTCLLEAVDAHDQRILAITLPGPTGKVTFECGADAGVLDRAETRGPARDLKLPWTHWAFTKNLATATMQIFRNGVLYHSVTQKRRPLAAAAKLVIGRDAAGASAYYKGQFTELSIWNTELTEQQIQKLFGRQLTGSEGGLFGYWKFGKDEAKDGTGSKNTGAYSGGPQLLAVPELAGSQIAAIGNILNVSTHEEAGTIQVPSQSFDGLLDYIELPPASLPSGSQISVSVWVRGGSGPPRRSSVISAADKNGERILNVHLPWQDGVLYFDCGKSFDRVQRAVDKSLYQGTFTHWVFTKNTVSGEMAIYCNGALWLAEKGKSKPLAAAAVLSIGLFQSSEGTFCYLGDIAEVSIWNRALDATAVQGLYRQRLTGQEPGLSGYWRLDGNKAQDLGPKGLHGTVHGTARPGGAVALSGTVQVTDEGHGFGKLAEVRIWNSALSSEEVDIHSKLLLTGNEPELLAYYPLSEATGVTARDNTGQGNDGMLRGAAWWACTAPIGLLRDDRAPRRAIVCAEYATVGVEPLTQTKISVMRRLLATPSLDGAQLLSDKRIELLDRKWVGNGQFAPTLLGYIEGSPPVPSENLTGEINYNGATSVELKVSEDVEFRWSRSQESGLGASLDTFLGVDTQTYAGLGVATKAADVRAGFKGNLNTSDTRQNESNVTTTASQYQVDRLELRGSPEVTAKFPRLGVRFVPKNVGYALVISSLADIFIIKLARSGRMVGYQVSPVDGVPPDINTITFLMNPAYVMQGSLDGLTGSSATSERFFKQVPELRAQYGSLYPASYYRLQEAYDLKQQIENDDKRRESYFAQFDVGSADEDTVDKAIDSGPAPAQISVDRQEDKAGQPLGEEEQKAADKARGEKLKKEAAASADAQTAAVTKRQEQIEKKIADENKRAHAAASFASWQQKMEDIVLRAGKRNIVNTYVWDADGGLRTESQSFASTAEHTIGGSFSLDAGLGGEGAFGAFGAKVELTALATIRMTQSLSKTQSTSRGLELNVDLSGVESSGVTDHDDNPLVPGEKVQRYRMMSFYLENSTRNFYDFFSYVVDPEWLRSNGEEARALRQAMGKANKSWRVLHRVTYVERPALLNFGRDLRTVPGQGLRDTDGQDRATQEILGYFKSLEEKHKALETRFIQLQEQQQTIQGQLAQLIALLKK